MHQIPSGNTILRTLFSWGFSGFCRYSDDLMAVTQTIGYFGLQTAIGAGMEVLDPVFPPANGLGPPTQRWLAWEARTPHIAAYLEGSGTVFVNDGSPDRKGDVQGQVLATGIPGGDQLEVWASFGVSTTWPDDGLLEWWAVSRVLIRSP